MEKDAFDKSLATDVSTFYGEILERFADYLELMPYGVRVALLEDLRNEILKREREKSMKEHNCQFIGVGSLGGKRQEEIEQMTYDMLKQTQEMYAKAGIKPVAQVDVDEEAIAAAEADTLNKLEQNKYAKMKEEEETPELEDEPIEETDEESNVESD